MNVAQLFLQGDAVSQAVALLLLSLIHISAARVPFASIFVAMTIGATSACRSKAFKFRSASSTDAECQKAATQRITSAPARCKNHDFHKITTQLPTDMANSNSATAWLTASPCKNS